MRFGLGGVALWSLGGCTRPTFFGGLTLCSKKRDEKVYIRQTTLFSVGEIFTFSIFTFKHTRQ